MAGYPALPKRTAFGPTYRDADPIEDPTTQLGAGAVNLACWQLAGAGRTLPRALLVFDGATQVVSYQALAWDPDGALPALAITRSAAGAYSFTFATNYPDENGNAIAYSPIAAMAIVQGASPQRAATASVAGQVVSVAVQDNAGTGVDGPVLAMVW